MAWKYFIPNQEAENIRYLNGILPNHCFADGSHKNQKGVFAWPKGWDSNRAYGEKKASKDIKGGFFWEPTEENKKKINLKDWETPNRLRSVLTLNCGQEVSIVSACGKPKKVLFGCGEVVLETKDEEFPFANNYNKSYRYGELAYGLLNKLGKDRESVDASDPEVIELLEQGWKASYIFGFDVLNVLIDVDVVDVVSMFYFCMGANLDELTKKKDN